MFYTIWHHCFRSHLIISYLFVDVWVSNRLPLLKKFGMHKITLNCESEEWRNVYMRHLNPVQTFLWATPMEHYNELTVHAVLSSMDSIALRIIIHSFIQYEDFYGAPSWWQLMSAPEHSTAKKKSFSYHFRKVKWSNKGSERTTGNKHSAKDGQFQNEGPTTEETRVCLVFVRAKGR